MINLGYVLSLTIEEFKAKKNREELHHCLEFLRFFFVIPLFSTLSAIASNQEITFINVKAAELVRLILV